MTQVDSDMLQWSKPFFPRLRQES